MTAIPCPQCGAPLASGACTACGGRALVALDPQGGGAACANHPGRRASASCARCGRFCCAVCLVEVRRELRCHRCRPPPEGVPWEGAGFPWPAAYARTVWALAARPTVTARKLAAGHPLAPVAFALAAIALSFASSAALVVSVEPKERGDVALVFAVLAALFALGFLVVQPLVDWLALRALGVRLALRESFKLSAYACAPLALGLIPFTGCTLLPLWAVALRLVLLRARADASWLQLVLATVAVPLLLAALVIAFRWDLGFR